MSEKKQKEGVLRSAVKKNSTLFISIKIVLPRVTANINKPTNFGDNYF